MVPYRYYNAIYKINVFEYLFIFLTRRRLIRFGFILDSVCHVKVFLVEAFHFIGGFLCHLPIFLNLFIDLLLEFGRVITFVQSAANIINCTFQCNCIECHNVTAIQSFLIIKVLTHLIAVFGIPIRVYVRETNPLPIHKPLEVQIIFNAINLCYIEKIRDDAPGHGTSGITVANTLPPHFRLVVLFEQHKINRAVMFIGVVLIADSIYIFFVVFFRLDPTRDNALIDFLFENRFGIWIELRVLWRMIQTERFDHICHTNRVFNCTLDNIHRQRSLFLICFDKGLVILKRQIPFIFIGEPDTFGFLKDCSALHVQIS